MIWWPAPKQMNDKGSCVRLVGATIGVIPGNRKRHGAEFKAKLSRESGYSRLIPGGPHPSRGGAPVVYVLCGRRTRREKSAVRPRHCLTHGTGRYHARCSVCRTVRRPCSPWYRAHRTASSTNADIGSNHPTAPYHIHFPFADVADNSSGSVEEPVESHNA